MALPGVQAEIEKVGGHRMTDYISREAAIEAVESALAFHSYAGSTAASAIAKLPAADVREVKRGKWEKEPATFVWNADGIYAAAYKCSNCGAISPFKGDYCFNCGADMRSTDCTKTATADEEREVLNVRAWLNNGADMREEQT